MINQNRDRKHLLTHAAAMGGSLSASYINTGYNYEMSVMELDGLFQFDADNIPERWVLTEIGTVVAEQLRART